MAYASLRRLAKRVLRTVRDVYRYFAFRHSQRRGVYEDFPQAEAALPPGTKTGYNHEDLARDYQATFKLALDSSEYPGLFHLDRVLQEHSTVLDMGGNIGVHYLRYRPYLKLETVKWIVCDVPEITKVGRKTCAGIPNVDFVNDVAEFGEGRVDVFHASDCLQYIVHWDLLLRKLIDKGMRPANIVIDQVPVYDGRQFVTVQNGGLVYYPQYVFNRDEFLGTITNLGYELVDAWSINGTACIIPFHPEKDVHAFSGFCFSDSSGSRVVKSIGQRVAADPD